LVHLLDPGKLKLRLQGGVKTAGNRLYMADRKMEDMNGSFSVCGKGVQAGIDVVSRSHFLSATDTGDPRTLHARD
jgi:hypothetical protein